MDKQVMNILKDINTQCHNICSKNEKINSIVSEFLDKSINEQIMIIEGINDQSDTDSGDDKSPTKSPGKIQFARSQIILSPKAKKTTSIYQDLSGQKLNGDNRISMPMTEERKHIFEDTPSPTKVQDPFIEAAGGIMRDASEKKKMEKTKRREARERIK